MHSEERAEIAGSERRPDPSHERIGDVDPDTELEVTVYLRPSAALDWIDAEASRPLGQRRVLSREQLARDYGASRDDVEAVRSFARSHGLRVGDVSAGRRTVYLTGTVAAVTKAFGVRKLGVFRHPSGGAYRGQSGSLSVPAHLGEVITGVFGIDNRPQARPRLRIRFDPRAQTSYTPLQVAQAYNFPTSVTGAGETVAVIELGGGYSQSDLDQYFSGLGLQSPTVTAVSVDGGTNAPGSDPDADAEVMLDLEVVGAVAQGARLVAYFSGTSDQNFLDAVSTATHDTTNKPSVISISWGGPEESWTAQARTQMEQILTEAAAVGVTVTVASGDDGSTDGVSDGKQHVDFPASAPHALACGGTSLQIANGSIVSEVAWNDGAGGGATGGGVSVDFALPSYQADSNVPNNVNTGKSGRGVPDVAGDADPSTGYSILVDGAAQTVGGTSAVAPLWAGLVALLNQALGQPLGFAQPRLYAATARSGFHDITQGNNGAYEAAAGWDACTGLGSPDGGALQEALGQ